MKHLKRLFDNNRDWAAERVSSRPDFFERLVSQQNPDYLWIGCSDSRVPANEIVGLLPGELFVHRNVANVVVHTDLNCLSVLQYAVDVLGVHHVIVCGHYGCGGVRAALTDGRFGLIDNWLRHVKDVYGHHRDVVDAAGTDELRAARLCELNVLEQARNVCETTIVREAWERGQRLAIHTWIYALSDGRLRDVGFSPGAAADVAPMFANALASLRRVPGFLELPGV